MNDPLKEAGSQPAFRKLQQEKLSNAITCHGRAWIAINNFVETMISLEELEKMEDEFKGGEFYPQKVISLAKERLNKLWYEVNEAMLAQEKGEGKE